MVMGDGGGNFCGNLCGNLCSGGDLMWSGSGGIYIV